MNPRRILAIPALSLLLLTDSQPSFGISLSGQTDSFVSQSRSDLAAFVEWTKSDKQLSGRLKIFELDANTLKSRSSNVSFSGFQDRSSISLKLSDGRIIRGTFRGDSLFLVLLSQNGMPGRVEFHFGTIKDYNQSVAGILSKKYTILAYHHFVTMLKDIKTRLKAVPQFDSARPGGFQDRYEAILASMRSTIEKGDRAVQRTSDCYRRETIKNYTLSQVSSGYMMANSAHSFYRTRIRDAFENDIQMMKSDLDGASRDLRVILGDSRSKSEIPIMRKVDLKTYFQDFSRTTNDQIASAVSKFGRVERTMALYDAEAKTIYDSSQQEFQFQACPP